MKTYLNLFILVLASMGIILLSGATEPGCDPEPEDPVGCEYDGAWYQVGESFLSSDNCNTCYCSDNGLVACTQKLCGCMYNGAFHAYGESFPADDGCNTCSCMEGGGVACTKMYCTCNGDEWYRDYMTTDVDQCAVIKFSCPDYTTYFLNNCGCGCQQSKTCEENYDCEPPTDCSQEMAECPYSTFAL